MNAVFLDFDHTLFDTDRFFHAEIRDLVERYGVTKEQWEAAYTPVRNSGFTFEKYVDEIIRLGAHDLPRDKMVSEFRNRVTDLSSYVFPDVLPFLQKAQESKADLYLLSFGAPLFQHVKLDGSGIKSYFTSIIITESDHKKADEIAKYEQRYEKISYVDNNSAELDLVVERFPKVATYFMNRVGVRGSEFSEAQTYLDHAQKHHHIFCKSLGEVKI